MWWLSLLISPASAEMPLPSYKEEVIVAAWLEVDAIIEHACAAPLDGSTPHEVPCDPDRLQQAIDLATRFNRIVVEDPRIHYLIGLAHRQRGELGRATNEFRRALAMDETRLDAWLGLGEVLQAQQQYDQADDAYATLSEKLLDGPNTWLPWFHRAELAAYRGDVTQFENHLREAVLRGFSFIQIRYSPVWQAFYADPTLRDSIEKLITVYSDRSVLDTLNRDPQERPP
jgi:tetratricopeptide (TPR) repeat protein